ncbi:MAG TPA: site-2 protease family protein [Kofleriaceae bacterium]|jgi:Zn-dependent protease
MSSTGYKLRVLAGDMFRRTQRTWRIGKVAGFPIDLKASFIALLAVVFFMLGGVKGLVLVSVLFTSVILHELGHAVVARHLGLEVPNIEFGFLGGAARMSGMPRRANHEIAIAAAGPAVSLALAGAGFGLGALLDVRLISMIGWMNLVIAGFNLIPALPMDGGRILRAALSHRYPFAHATRMAVSLARVFAVIFALFGVYVGSLQMIILAPLLWWMGNMELAMAAQIQDQFGGYPDDPDREIDQMARNAWSRQHGGAVFGGGQRRYTIRSVNGRVIIEVLD